MYTVKQVILAAGDLSSVCTREQSFPQWPEARVRFDEIEKFVQPGEGVELWNGERLALGFYPGAASPKLG